MAGGHGVGFNGDGARPVTNEGVGPAFVWSVVEGIGDGAGEGIAYVGYGPGSLRSLFAFCSNSTSAVGGLASQAPDERERTHFAVRQPGVHGSESAHLREQKWRGMRGDGNDDEVDRR